MRGFIPLRLEQFVGDTHFNVIRFAGEQEQRLVLSLPSETGNRAVIAVLIRLAGDRAAGEHNIRPAANPQRALVWCVGGLVREEHAVRDLFDQPRAKYRSGNTEDDIVSRHRCRKIRLFESTAGRVRSASDGEQVMDTTVRSSVGVSYKPRLSRRPVEGDERRNRIGGAVFRGKCDLRIYGRTGPPDCRLRMADRAAIQIHHGP